MTHVYCAALMAWVLGVDPDVRFLLEWTPPDMPPASISEMESLCTKVLDKTVELDPATRASILFRRAKLRAQSGEQIMAGLADLEAAHTLNPDDVNIAASFSLSRLLRGGTLAELLATGQRMIKKHPRQPHGHYLCGVYCVQKEDYRTAQAHFTAAFDCDRTMTSTLLGRAGCHVNLMEYEKALDDLSHAMSMRPLLPGEQCRLYSLCGFTYYRQEKYAEAIPMFHFALMLHHDPGKQVRSALWECYRKMGMYESCLRVAQTDVSLQPNDGIAHICLALALAHAGDLEGAFKHGAEAVDLAGSNSFCWKSLGRIHAARGAFQDSIHAFVMGQPYDAESSLYAAFILATGDDDRIRNGKKAVLIYEATTHVFPSPVPPHLSLVGACCYAEAGDFEKAVEFAKTAVEHSPAGSPIEGSAKHLLNRFENRTPYRLDRDRTLRPFDLPVLENVIFNQKPAIP